MMSRCRPPLLTICLALAWLVSGCTRPDAAAAPGINVLPVTTEVVAYQDGFELQRTYTGEVVARQTAELGFELNGRVVEILVAEGDAVAAGAELARLDDELLVAERARLAAERDAAAARLDELRAGPRREEIAAARGVVEELAALHERSMRRRDRLESLRDSRAITAEEFEFAYFEQRAIAGRLQAAQSRLDELLAGSREEQVTAQEATVRALDASLQLVDTRIAKTRFTAPFAGAIGRRWVDEGATVGAGEPVVRLVERGALEVKINIPPLVMQAVRQRPDVTLKVGGHSFAARLKSALPEIDLDTRTAVVVFQFDGGPSVLVGQLAQLEVSQHVAERGVWVPMAGIVRGVRGLWSCYAVVPDADANDGEMRVQRRDVEVLHVEAGRAFVRGTIRDGDRIVQGGVNRIVPGQRVRLQPGGT